METDVQGPRLELQTLGECEWLIFGEWIPMFSLLFSFSIQQLDDSMNLSVSELWKRRVWWYGSPKQVCECLPLSMQQNKI